MGYIHSIFLILSGLFYALLLFDVGSSPGNVTQAPKIAMILMAPALWGCLLLNGKPKTQVRFLKITQIMIVVLSVLYYYLLWSTGIFGQWFDSVGGSSGWMLGGLAPILGYVFLSLSVRTLTRNLKLLDRVHRLRD